MKDQHITILHFTEDGRFYCDGLAEVHPGLRGVRIGGGLQPGEIGCPSCPRFTRCGMSHVSTVAAEITDIDAVIALCKEKGWKFKKDQKTYEWYGHFVGDAPLPKGMKVEDLGKCAHAIGVPGTSWEIGLVKNDTTGGYKLAYDYYGRSGQPLQEAIGKDGGKFLQGYGICKAKLIAKKNGWMVKETTLPNGTIRLKVTGV